MYYLIGEKLGHSYSAEIHRALGRYRYELREIPRNALGEFLRIGDFDGLNVTIPYKSEVIPYLDALDETAQNIGSVNTVVRREGRLIGYNTDYGGFLAMAHRAGISFLGRKVLILGTGGTSLTAQAVARAGGAREIAVLSRHGENSYETLPKHVDSDIVINATPVGMYPENGGVLVDLAPFRRLSGVIDVIYNPLHTVLLDQAERLGIPSVGGLYMLVAQAVLACSLFTGETVSFDEIDRIYLGLLREKENIVLVGMPGCGKSTVARLLAEGTGREVIDTDTCVERAVGRTIPEIIASEGEAAFRAYERAAVVDAGRRSGVIIATGGGAVLDAANRYPLVQNGKVYFLARALDKLAREGRPLSLGADLAKMYEVRLPRYLAAADVTIDNNGTPEEAAAAITEDLYAHPDLKRT